MRNDDEVRAAQIAHEILGEDFPVSVSSEIGSMGLIERENATILNAALTEVAERFTDGFAQSLKDKGIVNAEVYLSQNDGTLMTLSLIHIFVKAIPMIRQAGLDGSDMIMFPEMFTTGYELSIVGPRITELAEPVNGPTITALREAAKQAGVYVVAPIALYHDDLPGVPFNSAVLIDREGNVAGVYDKQHLWALERFYFRGGNGTPVFQTDFGTIGIMICYDMGYPEVARMLALQGAQIVLCPSAWCEPDHDVWAVSYTHLVATSPTIGTSG